MAFEEIQEKLKADAMIWVDRLNENPSVQTLKDRYQNLSATGQKAVTVLAIVLITLLLGFIPYGYYIDSSDSLEEFESRRALIRDLQRTYKADQENSAGVQLTTFNDVQARVDSILTAAILPEQKKGISREGPGPMIKESLVDGVVNVAVAQLNLRQVTALSADFGSIQGTKLKDILMDASAADPRYYDVVYRIVVFKDNTPPAEPEPPPAKKRGGR